MTRKIENEQTAERILGLLPFVDSNPDKPCQSQNSETSDACSIPMVIRDFVLQVERTYKGLGLQVLYGTLSILANKSVFFIGGRGSGKTRTISCIPDVESTLASKCDTFTMGELDSLCGEHGEILLGVRNKHFVFKVEEFATLSEYHREMFLTVCSKLSSDGNYRHITSTTPNLAFADCKLTMLVAIQPILYSLLCYRHPNWEAMSYDRFTKFLMLNPLRTDTVEEYLVPTLPRKIPLSLQCQILSILAS